MDGFRDNQSLTLRRVSIHFALGSSTRHYTVVQNHPYLDPGYPRSEGELHDSDWRLFNQFTPLKKMSKVNSKPDRKKLFGVTSKQQIFRGNQWIDTDLDAAPIPPELCFPCGNSKVPAGCMTDPLGRLDYGFCWACKRTSNGFWHYATQSHLKSKTHKANISS